ncbi:mitogen-activated protein kinase kinase kinase, partial [Teratosphaeriaceae sp. CCFEE 6253]
YSRGASGDFTPLHEIATQQQRYGAGDGTYHNQQSQNHYQSWLSNAQALNYQQQQQQQQQQQVSHPQNVPTPPQQQSNYPPPTPTAGRPQKTLILPAKETQEHPSPAVQTQNPYPFNNAPPSRQPDEPPSTQATARDHSSSGDTPSSPQDQTWSLERVQLWLAAHSFSREWRAAFQHLNV